MRSSGSGIELSDRETVVTIAKVVVAVFVIAVAISGPAMAEPGSSDACRTVHEAHEDGAAGDGNTAEVHVCHGGGGPGGGHPGCPHEECLV